MSKTRDDYHHGDLRAALVREARAVVERKGDATLSLRACARALGVDVSAAYRHFKSKDAVLAAVAASGFQEFGRLLSEAARANGDDGRRCLTAVGIAYTSFGIAHPHLYRLMFGGRVDLSGVQAERKHTPGEYAFDVLNNTLDMLVEEKLISKSNRPGAEFMVWSMVHGMVMLLIDKRGKSDPSHAPHFIERTTELVVRGLS